MGTDYLFTNREITVDVRDSGHRVYLKLNLLYKYLVEQMTYIDLQSGLIKQA